MDSMYGLERDLEELLEQVRAQRAQRGWQLGDPIPIDDFCPGPDYSGTIPPTTISAFYAHNRTLRMTALAATGHQSITAEMTSRFDALMAADHLQLQVYSQVDEASQSLFAACNANLTLRGQPPMTFTDFEHFRVFLSNDTESAAQQIGWNAHQHINEYLGWVKLGRPFDRQSAMNSIFERGSDGRMTELGATFDGPSADGFGVAHLSRVGMLFKPAKQKGFDDGFSYSGLPRWDAYSGWEAPHI